MRIKLLGVIFLLLSFSNANANLLCLANLAGNPKSWDQYKLLSRPDGVTEFTEPYYRMSTPPSMLDAPDFIYLVSLDSQTLEGFCALKGMKYHSVVPSKPGRCFSSGIPFEFYRQITMSAVGQILTAENRPGQDYAWLIRCH